MLDRTMREFEPSLEREDVIEQFNRFLDKNGMPPIEASELTYCSWPEMFGSTSGPFHGIGGQAFTTFRMEAWVHDMWGYVFTHGKFVRVGRLFIYTDGN